MTAATDAFAAGLVGLTEALRAACNDPADAVRLLTNLANFFPALPPGTASVAQSIDIAETASAALARRAALSSLARAAAAYQPVSYDDAITVRNNVCDLLDAEAVVAADGGDVATYQALRALRQAVSLDLTTRGAGLARLVTVTRPRPLPALVLAWQLYQDATRADDLTARADPINPAFMPTSFEVLSQ